MKVEVLYLDHVEAADTAGLEEMLLNVNRCAAVTKGGRRFSFSALSVIGNRDGIVGHGFGKAGQVPAAIEKAAKDGRKHLMRVPVVGAKTIPHEVSGYFCGAHVRLLPASDGTGLIAGQSVRAVCEMAGIRNILSKSFGSSNATNLVKATLAALAQLRTAEEVAALRGVEL